MGDRESGSEDIELSELGVRGGTCRKGGRELGLLGVEGWLRKGGGDRRILGVPETGGMTR